MRIGSLFSGIGGLELGLEWAGVGETRWQVEIDPYCRRVLARHWPQAERFEDVTAFGGRPADLICGGFPCQDLSAAGKQKGIDHGERSGLWREFERIVGAVRPQWVVVENVAHTWRKWVPRVRGDLHRLGYASVPLRVRASDVGAWHERARIFVVADLDGQHLHKPAESAALRRAWTASLQLAVSRAKGAAADACGVSRTQHNDQTPPVSEWSIEPDVARVVHGLSGGVDGRRRREREKALGNSVVPQAAMAVGHFIQSLL